MERYRPKDPFTVPMVLLIPKYVEAKGSAKKKYPEIKDGLTFFGSFKTYGGTETVINDMVSVEDTANIETWYRPDITSDCRVAIAGSEDQYEIMGVPENINMRNQYTKFKVRRIEGGA